MARYLCQLCNTLVTYGENHPNHPCFSYKKNNSQHTASELYDPEEISRYIDETEEKFVKNSNENEEPKNISFNPNFPASRSFLPENEILDKDLFEVSRDRTYTPVSHKVASQVPSTSGDKVEIVKEPLNFLQDANAVAQSSGKDEIVTVPFYFTQDANVVAGSSGKVEIGKEPLNSSQDDNVMAGSSGEVEIGKESLNSSQGANAAPRSSESCMDLLKNAEKQRFLCDMCPKKFPSKYHLALHYRTHTGEKPFLCDICGKGFSAKGNLKTHVLIHTGGMPFQCVVCKKGFARKYHLKEHALTHTGEKL